jgi:hypothetical protein
MSRTDDVTAARSAADEWAAGRGLPSSGGYSGDWYINGYLGGWWPADWVYWMADYSKPPELFPMRPAHQFSSTPIDQDAMLESEISTPTTPPPPPDDPCAAITVAHDALVVTVADIADRLGDALLEECKRLVPRKSVIKGIVAQMAAERTNAIGPRP